MSYPVYPAFRVRYLGPTDAKGGRYKASCHGYSETLTAPYDHELRPADQAAKVARRLREKIAPDALPITSTLVGDLSDSDYVVTFGVE